VLIDLRRGVPRTDLLVLAVIVVCGITEYSAVRLQQRRNLRSVSRRAAPAAAPAPAGHGVPAAV
jgi:hypothetical protein